MANEVNQKEKPLEMQSGEQNALEAGGVGQRAVSEARVAELESLVAQRDEELAKANARLIELEQVVATRDSDVAELKQSKGELEVRLTHIGTSLDEAVAGYKALVVQANPDVIEELVSGGTIEAINESLGKAKTLVNKVRQGLEAEISLARVPAGAPERASPDLSALSPREKIQYAIKRSP